MSLHYDIITRRYETEGEVMFKAFTNELNPNLFYGIGDTRAEAIDSFERIKEDLFEQYLEEGKEIPRPEPEEEDLPSGRFIVRIAPKTHKNLIQQASKNGQSLNMLINDIFSKYYTSEKVFEMVEERLKLEIGRCIIKLESAYSISGYEGETTIGSELSRYEKGIKATA
jgi:predicted HicB family RNase H-like nuclease